MASGTFSVQLSAETTPNSIINSIDPWGQILIHTTRVDENTISNQDMINKAEEFYKFTDIRARGGQVIVDEFINIQREAFRLQKDIYNAIQAAKEFGLVDKVVSKRE